MTETTIAAATFTPAQVALIKQTIAKGASDDELALFLAQCQRANLDPFNREIYFLKRKQWNAAKGAYEEVGQTQVSIDGLRVIAERTGEMDGQDVMWCGPDGAWRDVWLEATPPAAARVLVYRKNCTHPFPAVARFDEYAQHKKDGSLVGMWAKMPANQLAKCAESLALRKALPRQLSGLYTREEMAQADSEPVPAYTVTAPELLVAAAPLPEGTVRLLSVTPGSKGSVQWATIVYVDAHGEQHEAKTAGDPKGGLAALCEQLAQEGVPVELTTRLNAKGVRVIDEVSRWRQDAPTEPPAAPEEAIVF